MKRRITSLLTGVSLFLPGMTFSQTATDFTANDCNGVSHHLFSELDAGKVVVISFVMPCSMCIAPSQSAFAVVKNFASSHPGKVVYYIADDKANTSCSALSVWATDNELESVTLFANASVVETPYGSGGMPKIVVLGGPDHKVYYTENGGLNTTNLTNAINTALAASTGITEKGGIDFQLAAYPNPATNKLSFHYVVSQPGEVGFEIYSLAGTLVKKIAYEKLGRGDYENTLNLEDFTNGIYLLRIQAGEHAQTVKFTVVR